MKKLVTLGIICIILLLCACTARQALTQTQPGNSQLPSATNSQIPTATQTLTLTITPLPQPNITSTETITSGWDWETTQSIQQTKEALATQNIESFTKTQAVLNTQIAEFPIPCEHLNNNVPGSVSPDGEWYAVNCGYMDKTTLVIQNRTGIKYELDITNFVNPDTEPGWDGFMPPEFWTQDGRSLIFSTNLVYDTDGPQCFVKPNLYGLFMIDLATGSPQTILAPTTNGVFAKISPYGQYLAMNQNGITIFNIWTKKSISFDAAFVQSYSWSPDENYLVYTTAECEDMYANTSSAYVYDLKTNQTHLLIQVDNEYLTADEWPDSNTIQITGDTQQMDGVLHTYYLFSVEKDFLLISEATATPFQ